MINSTDAVSRFVVATEYLCRKLTAMTPILHPHRINRIRKLLDQISAGLYERDHLLALSLLSAVAGESIFLLGQPGVGKSLVARRLKLAFHDARSFEYLMSRFSTPDEIFGPVSISKLKDCDTYERLTDGYLPSADFVFLDEIWKAGPSIQNALLTVLNEKIFRNGQTEMHLPLKGIIAASNELPAANEGLEALWDRFLLRVVVPPLLSDEAFMEMITGYATVSVEIENALRITPQEYRDWQSEIDRIEVGEQVQKMILKIRAMLKTGFPTGEDNELRPVYVSDRRWKKIVRLLRTAACLNGCEEVDLTAGFLIGMAVWNEAGQIVVCTSAVDRIVIDCITEPFERELKGLEQRREQIRKEAVKRAGNNGRALSRFRIIGNHYYNIVGYNDGNTLIDIEEYNLLRPHVTIKASCAALKSDENLIFTTTLRASNAQTVMLTKNRNSLNINGVDYPIELAENRDFFVVYPQAEELLGMIDRELESLLLRVKEYIHNSLSQKSRSPFVADSQYKRLKGEFSRLTLQIRKMRNTLFQLSNDE